MKKVKLGWFVSIFALVVLAVGVWANRYNIYDWVVLRSYDPPAEVTQLAVNAGLNGYGTRLFYINKPQISDRESFAAQCNEREQTIILGCYNGRNIYIFKVDNDRLKGVEEVTAAHETLHSAYDRLSANEKKKVDALTKAAYEKITDPELSKRIESYKVSEPGEVPNELHSILGTEVRNIGPELEQYYKKYFDDRLKVVGLAEAYEKVFIDIQDKVQRYDANLALRRAEIETRENTLEAQGNDLRTQRRQLDEYIATKNYESYNTLVPSYNVAVRNYNQEIGAVKQLINEFNQLVQERNEIAADQANLVKSIDSRLSTIESE